MDKPPQVMSICMTDAFQWKDNKHPWNLPCICVKHWTCFCIQENLQKQLSRTTQKKWESRCDPWSKTYSSTVYVAWWMKATRGCFSTECGRKAYRSYRNGGMALHLKSKSCKAIWHKQIQMFPHLTQVQTSVLHPLHFVIVSLWTNFE